MMPTRQGSFRLFRLFGIDVHLHWSWLFVAIYSVSVRVPNYRSPVWALLEYLALFLIVLMHEYGHSLACRSVGGQADQIVLWPLGGVAYVSPPPRPGAVLWSLAAGPLVNVVLFPFLVAAIIVGERAGWETNHADLNRFIWAVGMVNALLLGFNLMPVYPLDGGQILRAVLWFFIGKARSLTVATVVGFLGGAVFVLYALLHADLWLGGPVALPHHELLARVPGGADAPPGGAVAAAARVRLPGLPVRAADRRLLALPAVPPAVRPVRQQRGLPALRLGARGDRLPGLRPVQADPGLGCSRP